MTSIIPGLCSRTILDPNETYPAPMQQPPSPEAVQWCARAYTCVLLSTTNTDIF